VGDVKRMSSGEDDKVITRSLSMPTWMFRKLGQKAKAKGNMDRSTYIRELLAEKWRAEEATLFDLTPEQREEFVRALSGSELWKQNLRALAGIVWEFEKSKRKKRREEG